MKKAKRSELVFDLEYVQDIAPEKAQARRVADMWRLYLECRPVTNQLRETLLRDIETEIEQAIKSGDAGFFRRFANYIEKPKEPCRIRTWLLYVHIDNNNGPDTRFTHAELVQGVIREVFEIHAWHPAGTLEYRTRTPQEVKSPDRWEFSGAVAAKLSARYKGGSVEKYFPKGAQLPFTYLNC